MDWIVVDWNVVLDIAVMLGLGVLAVFGLVAFAMPDPKGERLRALPRGTRRVTNADLEEAHDRAWREEMAASSMRRGGGL